MTLWQIIGASLLSFLCVCVGWIRWRRYVKRKQPQFPAAERFRATKASLRGALREGER